MHLDLVIDRRNNGRYFVCRETGERVENLVIEGFEYTPNIRDLPIEGGTFRTTIRPRTLITVASNDIQIRDITNQTADRTMTVDQANNQIHIGPLSHPGLSGVQRMPYLFNPASTQQLAGYDPRREMELIEQRRRAEEVFDRDRANVGEFIERQISEDIESLLIQGDANYFFNERMGMPFSTSSPPERTGVPNFNRWREWFRETFEKREVAPRNTPLAVPAIGDENDNIPEITQLIGDSISSDELNEEFDFNSSPETNEIFSQLMAYYHKGRFKEFGKVMVETSLLGKGIVNDVWNGFVKSVDPDGLIFPSTKDTDCSEAWRFFLSEKDAEAILTRTAHKREPIHSISISLKNLDQVKFEDIFV